MTDVENLVDELRALGCGGVFMTPPYDDYADALEVQQSRIRELEAEAENVKAGFKTFMTAHDLVLDENAALAAVIEKVRAQLERSSYHPFKDELFETLSAASSDVLREHDAEVWDAAKKAVERIHPRCTEECEMCAELDGGQVMPDLNETLAGMQAKTDAATEGPWVVERDHHTCYLTPGDECAHSDSPITDRIIFREGEAPGVTDAESHTHASYEAHRIDGVAGNYDYEEGGILNTADAEFIAMARTAMPALLSAVKNVLAVHKRQIERSGANGWAPHELCSEDEKSWPCPTVKALTDALEGGE